MVQDWSPGVHQLLLIRFLILHQQILHIMLYLINSFHIVSEVPLQYHNDLIYIVICYGSVVILSNSSKAANSVK